MSWRYRSALSAFLAVPPTPGSSPPAFLTLCPARQDEDGHGRALFGIMLCPAYALPLPAVDAYLVMINHRIPTRRVPNRTRLMQGLQHFFSEAVSNI